jgi:transposase InsO family protein
MLTGSLSNGDYRGEPARCSTQAGKAFPVRCWNGVAQQNQIEVTGLKAIDRLFKWRPPFAGTGLLGLSRLSLGWMKLGIVHERIQAGRPQQNGRHERMHRTLKEDTMKPPAASLRAQQGRFDNLRPVFNHERPHEGLNNQVPASH